MSCKKGSKMPLGNCYSLGPTGLESPTHSKINGALHTGTETWFTGSRFLIQIQCGLVWAPHQYRLHTLHCWTGSHALSQSTFMQHSMQFGSWSRPCGGKVVFWSGSLICVGSRSVVLCGEPQWGPTLAQNGIYSVAQMFPLPRYNICFQIVQFCPPELRSNLVFNCRFWSPSFSYLKEPTTGPKWDLLSIYLSS